MLVKIGKHIYFCVYRRPYLFAMWSSVLESNCAGRRRLDSTTKEKRRRGRGKRRGLNSPCAQKKISIQIRTAASCEEHFLFFLGGDGRRRGTYWRGAATRTRAEEAGRVGQGDEAAIENGITGPSTAASREQRHLRGTIVNRTKSCW